MPITATPLGGLDENPGDLRTAGRLDDVIGKLQSDGRPDRRRDHGSDRFQNRDPGGQRDRCRILHGHRQAQGDARAFIVDPHTTKPTSTSGLTAGGDRRADPDHPRHVLGGVT